MSGPARKIIKKRPRSISVRLPTDAVRHAWPDDVANNLARRIAWFRELRGLTQDQLAERAGLSRMAVNDAESGQTHMDMRTLVTLAAALETSVGVLLAEIERNAEFRSEYINGQMFAMSGGSIDHARIVRNALLAP